MSAFYIVLIIIIGSIVGISLISALIAFVKDLFCENVNRQSSYKMGIYEKYVKRPLDAFLSTGAVIIFHPLLLVIALFVKIKLGSPVIFKQPRPGKNERIFTLYKFRTMTEDKDDKGELLPDSARLTSFGRFLRKTSLDELPEFFNIIKGDMAIIGPRPQLVRDMVFMTDRQKLRHLVRPGLSGLAQINGRNSISWDEKLDLDLQYIQEISLINDFKLFFRTIGKTIIAEGITDGENVTALDYGDALLKQNKITIEQYIAGQKEAKSILEAEGY